MEKSKKSIGRLILGEWNTKTIVTMAVGAALYGVLMLYGSIPIFSQTNLSTAMVVPVIVGGYFGPVPCAITLFLGNIIADLIGGYGMWFDWSVGNAVLGFFVGLLPVYGARITEGILKPKHIVYYVCSCIVGNLVAFGLVTPVLTSLLYSSEMSVAFMMSVFAAIGNLIVLLVVGIPVLYIISKRHASRSNLQEEE